MRIAHLVGLAVIGLAVCVPAQQPAITSLQPDGTITWNNMATGCVAVVEVLPPPATGQWTEVHSQRAATFADSAQLPMIHRYAWLRVVNTDEPGAPVGMVLIPGGDNSGTNPLDPGESHTDCFYPATYALSVGSFYMDRYEVTNDKMAGALQWASAHGRIAVTASTVHNLLGNPQELLDLDDADCRITWDGSSFGLKAAKGANYPCVEVTWYGAAAYCNYRSEMEGLTPCYDLSDWSCDFDADGYRLPTEQEWEYAARGGAASKRFPWGGDTISHSQANYYASGSFSYDLSSGGYHPLYSTGGYPYTSPVGSFAANAYGLRDMAGNVWEWCNDWHPCYAGADRVVRGGRWGGTANRCRVGDRNHSDPVSSGNYLGFRALLPVDP